MNAILLTVFSGFMLVSFFLVLFFRYRRDAESSSPERDSLLPLEEENFVPDNRPRPEVPAAAPRL